MSTMRPNPASLRRVALLLVVLALLGSKSLLAARAEDQGEKPYNDSVNQQALCELLGGHATVEQTMNAAGLYVVTVTCHGGLLDGLACWWAWRIQPTDDLTPKVTESIEPLEEPTVAAPQIVDQTDVGDVTQTAPGNPEPALTPTSEATDVSGDSGEPGDTTPVVDNGAVGDGTIDTQAPGAEPPVIIDPGPGGQTLPGSNGEVPMVLPVIAPGQ
jgi:hypothetical protein